MLLNNSAVNTVVLDGQLTGNTYTQAMTASASLSTASIVKAVSATRSATSTSTATVSFIKSLVRTITTTATTSTVTVVKAATRTLTTTAVSSTASIVRAVKHTILSVSTSSAFISNLIGKKIVSSAVISTVTEIANQFFFKTFTIVSTASTSLVKQTSKILVTNIITSSASFVKTISKKVTTAVSSILFVSLNVIPKFGATFRDTFYAMVKKRKVNRVQSTDIVANAQQPQKRTFN